MTNKELDYLFIKKIITEEWSELDRRQTDLISMLTQRVTGRLLGGRRYGVSGQELNTIATETHPDYERFIDMKKLKRHGKIRDRISAKKGRPIHNSPIYSRINAIAYRINWDLAEEILGEIANGYNTNIKVAF